MALPLAAGHLWVIAVYPLVWGFVNHLCMTTLVSFLSSLSEEKRGAIMGLFSFTTYVSLGTAGAVYGTVYETHGLWAVSWAASAQLVAAAILVKFAFSPDRPR